MDITVTFTVSDSAAADVISHLLKHATTVTPIAEGKGRKTKAETAPAVPAATGLDFGPGAAAPTTPIPTTIAPTAAPAATPAMPGPSIAQVGTLVTEFMDTVGVPTARQIFAQFGIKKIVDLPPARIPEFVEALRSAREMSGK